MISVQLRENEAPEESVSVLNLVTAKLAWFVVTKISSLGMALALFLIAVVMVFRGGTIILDTPQNDQPTIPELERHLESNDKRLGNHDDRFERMVDLINHKFDLLEDDRQQRKVDSDKRYEALQHDVTFLYGGLAVIGILLGIGVIKLNSSSIDMSKRLSKEDIEQLGVLLASFRNARER
jgi:hypothetical protein